MNTDKIATSTSEEDKEFAIMEMNQQSASGVVEVDEMSDVDSLHPHLAYEKSIDHLRKDRDKYKERASYLEALLDKAEIDLVHYKAEVKANLSTITALKECLRLKELECAELVKDKEWPQNGDTAFHVSGGNYLFIGMLPVADDGEADCMIRSRTGGLVYRALLRELSKPESPEQKEARERAEAAYDLCCAYGHNDSESAKNMEAHHPELFDKWLIIVDKTGYRKATDNPDGKVTGE